MELVYRIREERLDRHGRATITADIHWGKQRLQLSTGVKVLPGNWQPTKKNQVNTREADANAKNLKLNRYSEKIGQVFTKATGEGRAEHLVMPDDIRKAVAPEPTAEEVEAAAAAVAPTEQTLLALHIRWQQENAGLAKNTLRKYNQVITKLEAFRPGLKLGKLTRKLVADYQVFLQREGLADSTFTNHVKFLREAFRTAGLNPPAYLKFRSPDARPVALTAEEFRQLIEHPFPPSQQHLADERIVFVFQALLLLRDSDLRRLRPGYVKEVGLLPGKPPVLVAGMPQQKTLEELAVPFPPLAEMFWRAYGGKLPIVAQQNRNERIKAMATAVGLSREIVKVRWVGNQMHETPLPLASALTTHSARHTGADLLLVGSGGDRNLVEIGLGHVNYVYGHDSIHRYGPQLLAAWAAVLEGIATVGNELICQRGAGKSSPEGTNLAA